MEGVLEILLLGGLSQYESLYCVEEFGASSTDPTQWHLFLESGDVESALSACGVTSDVPLLQPFGEDASGRTVNLGPFVLPLRDRPDLTDRMRVLVTGHDALPHEVAIPLALTGRNPADPAMASIGAIVERHLLEVHGSSASPRSLLLLPPSSIQTQLSASGAAIGLNRGAVRPLSLRMDGSSAFVDSLSRAVVTDPAAHDAVVDQLAGGLASRLSAGGARLRAARFDEVIAVNASLGGTGTLQSFLPKELLEKLRGESCGLATSANATAMSLRLAAHAMTSESPSRYVCVIDGGFEAISGAGGYDTHVNTPSVSARNLTSTLSALASIINRPGENDPRKLDLDRHMIVLNTEFGRTPHLEGQAQQKGRGHWPFGYPVALLGGPIRRDNAGIVGAIGPDARAEQAISPAAHRIAVLLALGIWPLEPESFNVSDVPGSASNEDAARDVARQVLGVSA